MQMTDDLEKLLLDVRKTIEDNREFLRNIAEDVDQEAESTILGEKDEKSDSAEDSEEFEEL